MIEPTATSIANVSSVTHASRPMHHSRSIEIRTTSAPEIHPRGDTDPYIVISRPSVVEPPDITPDRNSTSNHNITVIPPPPDWPGFNPPPPFPFPNFTIPSSGHYTDPEAAATRKLALGFGLGFGIPVVLLVAGALAVRYLRGPSGSRTAQEARPAAAASPDKVDKKDPAHGNSAAAAQAPEEIEMDTFRPDLEAQTEEQPVAQALALRGHDDDGGERLLPA